MAVNESRSRSVGLEQGLTDGAYKSLNPDREVAEDTTARARASLSPSFHDVQEAPIKRRPDGR